MIGYQHKLTSDKKKKKHNKCNLRDIEERNAQQELGCNI